MHAYILAICAAFPAAVLRGKHKKWGIQVKTMQSTIPLTSKTAHTKCRHCSPITINSDQTHAHFELSLDRLTNTDAMVIITSK